MRTETDQNRAEPKPIRTEPNKTEMNHDDDGDNDDKHPDNDNDYDGDDDGNDGGG